MTMSNEEMQFDVLKRTRSCETFESRCRRLLSWKSVSMTERFARATRKMTEVFRGFFWHKFDQRTFGAQNIILEATYNIPKLLSPVCDIKSLLRHTLMDGIHHHYVCNRAKHNENGAAIVWKKWRRMSSKRLKKWGKQEEVKRKEIESKKQDVTIR